MSFVALGITNVRRNMGRSTLALVGMALAAMILSASLPVAEGYPKKAYLSQRAFIGGDIVVYPGRFRPNRSEIGEASSGSWVFDRLPEDYGSDLRSFSPEYYRQGFLRTPEESNLYLDPEALLSKGLSEKPYVKSLAFYLGMPGLVRDPSDENRTQMWFSPLRARDLSLGSDLGLDVFITAGRAFTPEDDGKYCALVDARRHSLEGYEQIPPETTICVEVPKATSGPDGNYVFDYTARTSYDFLVIGCYALPTRSLVWQDDMGNTLSEQLYWATPQIIIPEKTLIGIWRDIADTESPPATQLSVGVNNVAYLENNAADLATLLPEYTVMSVPSQVETAWLRGLPEPVLRYPSPLADPDDIRQAGTPMDLRGIVVLITYSISALLVASNMLVALTARRKEIGILKALGAKSREIVLMVLSEVLFVSLAGALGGFLLLRGASLWQYISNRMPLAEIARLTFSELGRVMVTTSGFALLFGVLPAMFTTKMAAMEVLRNE